MSDDAKTLDRVDLVRESDFTIGQLLVSPSTCRVRAAGKEERVEPRVMAVIVALARAKGRTVSRERLVDVCWEGRIVSDDAINRVLAKARQLARCIDPPAFLIETTPKVGFRLTPAAPERASGGAGLPNLAEAGASVEGRGDARAEQQISVLAALRKWRARLGPWQGRGLAAVGLAVLVGALALAATLFSRPTHPGDQSGLVEIMRFNSLPPEDRNLQRLSTTLSPTLVRLFGGSGVNVVLQPTKANDGSSGPDAEFRVAGTLQRTAEALVIDAQILDRRSGLVLWSAPFERPIEEMTGLENEAAAAITGVLICALNETKADRARVTAEVFSLFLMVCDAGMHYAPERMLKASRRLVAAAPDLAAAHAMHASALVGVANETIIEPDEAALMIEQARASARHALRLDSQRTARAYMALAITGQGDLREIERNFQRALEIDPWLLSARAAYSGLLRDVGRTNAAIAWNNRTNSAADQYSWLHLTELALMHASLGNFREADAAIERLRRLDPESAYLRSVEWTIAIWWEDVGVVRSQLRMLGQETEQSERDIRCMDLYLSRLERQPSGTRGLPSECSGLRWDWRVRMLARQGDVDGSYALFEAGGPPNFRTKFLFYPEMRAFRRDPRFMPLAKRLGLVDYWIATDKWPDFCAEPDLPYDCRAAARASMS
jgi:DNA-binding winged helix-turn-helix (wHTH) protein/tetratricopeptide (TPR) repeat protein